MQTVVTSIRISATAKKNLLQLAAQNNCYFGDKVSLSQLLEKIGNKEIKIDVEGLSEPIIEPDTRQCSAE